MTHVSTSVVNIFHREAIRNIISRDVITIYDFIYNIIVSISHHWWYGRWSEMRKQCDRTTSNSTDTPVESLNNVSYTNSIFMNFLKSERITIVFSALCRPSILFTTDDICARCIISVRIVKGGGVPVLFFFFFFILVIFIETAIRLSLQMLIFSTNIIYLLSTSSSVVNIFLFTI